MNIPILTVTNQPHRAQRLVDSATKRGWDIMVIEVQEWKGFGTKLIETYNYLKQHPEIECFVFSDAYDVIVLGTPDEFKEKLGERTLLLSCERGLWPPTIIPFRSCYPNYEHGFNYINSGLYYMTSVKFIELYELFPPFPEMDDQIWMNLVWLLHLKGYKYPDFEQQVFNSHSFITDGEYTYSNNRLTILDNQSCFIHFNGSTLDPEFDKNIVI